MKNSLLSICSTNILVRLLTVNMKNCLTPKNPKMCDPILVTLLKMRPHYSQSSHEKGTPSSDTSLLASYKEYERAAPYERGGDARHLAKGCKFQILVSLRVFWVKHHYI